MTIQEAITAAAAHLNAGRLPDAESLCRRILQTAPRQPDALQLLGIIAFKANHPDAAIDLLRQAIAINPSSAEYRINLCAILCSASRFTEALVESRQAVALAPNSAEAHHNHGVALRSNHQLPEALAAFRQALALRPQSPDTFLQLGLTLKELGQLPDAAAAYRQALALRPNFPEALVNLGSALLQLGQTHDAVAAFRQAIALRPAFPEAHFNLGIALRNLVQPRDAAAAFQHAITLRPDFYEAWANFAASLHDLGQLPQAADAYRKALALRPQLADAHNALGLALNDLAQIDEALACYRNAIALDPNAINARNNLGFALKDAGGGGQLDEALAAYRHALALCDRLADPRAKDIHSNICYTIHFHPDYDAPAILKEHQLWNERYARSLAPATNPPANPDPNRRLRIGYVSPDFRDHVIGRNLIPLLAHHDHHQFEIFCYSDTRSPDHLTSRLQSHSDHWRNTVGLSDEQLAQSIRHDKIDILLDLALHMAGNRLLVFARKPAPLQITFAGYPGTTGLSAIDFRLTDPYLDPPSSDPHYSETSIRLPHSFWCYDPLTEMKADGLQSVGSVGPLPALTNGHITFGCFNNFCKINDRVLELWAKVLRALPTSRLLMLAPQTRYRQHTLDFLNQHAISPTRIELLDYRSRSQYLQLYHRLDLCLDTFPYNGHTTSLDGLYMGVPTITLVGQGGGAAPSRAGLSQLSNLNLTELAASTPEQFITIATTLASDLPRLATLRATLRDRMQASPLMNAPQFARDIEAAYLQVWQRWCTANRA